MMGAMEKRRSSARVTGAVYRLRAAPAIAHNWPPRSSDVLTIAANAVPPLAEVFAAPARAL
jgi:hypothetical protein